MKAEIQRLEAALAEIAATRNHLYSVEKQVTETLTALRVTVRLEQQAQEAAEAARARRARSERLALGLMSALLQSSSEYFQSLHPTPTDEPEQPDEPEKPAQPKQPEQPKQKPDAKGAKP